MGEWIPDESCEAQPPHDVCLIEEALHERGACSEHDQIVVGAYCPLVVCRRDGEGVMLPRHGDEPTQLPGFAEVPAAPTTRGYPS